MGDRKGKKFGVPLLMRCIDVSGELAGNIGGFCLLIMSLIICYGVLMRYVFGSPSIWVTEFSVYLCIAVGFIGASYTLKNNEHFAITIVVERLSPRKHKILKIVTDIMGIVYSLVFVWKGIDMVIFSYTFGDTSEGLLAIPLWIPELLVPIGGVLLLLQFLNRVAQEFIGGQHLPKPEL